MTGDPDRSARERLGEELVAAAVRQHEERASRSRGRRRRRAVLSIAAATILGAGAVAGAARLIATGEPLPDRTVPGARNQPADAPVLVAQVWDAERRTAWGVGLYTSDEGEDCALAGAVRGQQLGRIEGGVFRRYEGDYTGACAALDRALPISFDVLQVPGSPRRTILFGRTLPTARSVQVTHAGVTRTVRVARGGFLALFDGALTVADVQVAPSSRTP
jgi:hypothetical protein